MYIRDISIACSHFPQVVIQMSFSQRGLPCPPPSKIATNPFLADAVLLCQYPLRFLCHFCVHSLLVRVHSQQPTPVFLFRRAASRLLGPFSFPLMVDKGKWHKRRTKTKRALRQEEEGRESACPRVTYIS